MIIESIPLATDTSTIPGEPVEMGRLDRKRSGVSGVRELQDREHSVEEWASLLHEYWRQESSI